MLKKKFKLSCTGAAPRDDVLIDRGVLMGPADRKIVIKTQAGAK
jgi:hypothetical protein